MTDTNELKVLIEQLGELLAEGVDDGSDALEIATVAGLAERLGASAADLADAVAWRDSGGGDLIREELETVDLDKLVDRIEDVSERPGSEEQVDEAIADFDDMIAAAVWVGGAEAVRDATRQVAQAIRAVPDPFAFLAPDGRQMARQRLVAEDLDLYDYWFAIADAGDVV